MRSAPCLFTLNGTSGLISSDPAGNYKYCIWVITAPRGHNIRLNFTIFQLSDSISLGQNRINIYDGRGEDNALLGTFSGTRQPFVAQTRGRFMLVKLIKERIPSLCNFMAVYTSSTKKGERYIRTRLP